MQAELLPHLPSPSDLSIIHPCARLLSRPLSPHAHPCTSRLHLSPSSSSRRTWRRHPPAPSARRTLAPLRSRSSAAFSLSQPQRCLLPRRQIVSSMGCFFGCFPIKDGDRSQAHLFSNDASSKSRDPLVSRNQLSSLFSLEEPSSPYKDEEKNGLQSKYNVVDGGTDDRDFKAEIGEHPTAPHPNGLNTSNPR